MFGRRRRRLDEEIESHLAEETADNIARGMDAASARHAALRTFGNVEAAKEQLRALDPMYWLDTLWQDVRLACRQIARHRWISLTTVATLTVGIAVNVSVFSLLNGLLLRPWVHTEPETFVSLIPRFSGDFRLRYSDYASMSQPDYARYRDLAPSLESLAAYRLVPVTLSDAASGSIRGGLVSCNLFDTIGTGPPILGRYLTPGECVMSTRAAVTVLSETVWRSRFNADPRIVGRIVHLNRVPFTVVGVAPDFTLSLTKGPADSGSVVWVPYTMLTSLRPGDDYFSDPHAQWLTVIGRRTRGSSIQQVQQELSVLARRADEEVPGRVTSLIVTNGSLAQDPEMRARTPIIFLVTLGSTSLLLLLACVNVTTLLLSRAALRQREMSVRLSLGAGRFRLLRQLLTESLVLSGLAAATGFVIAQRAPAALWYSFMSGPAPIDLTPDWRVVLYCLGLATAAAVIAGLSPAVESLRPELAESLKASGASVTSGRRRSRLRSVLVAAQIALSLLLLVEVGLVIRAQQRVFRHDPGFETKQVLSVTLTSVLTGFAPGPSFYRELEARARAVPGVLHTSFASIAPWAGRNSGALTEIDGAPVPETRDSRQHPAGRAVSPEYFTALDVPLIRGRAFTSEEASSQTQVIPTVISEAMARRYWPGQDAIGHRFRVGAVREVIGVSRDVQSVTFMADDGPFYYSPLDTDRSRPAYLLVRVAGDPQIAIAGLRSIVRQVDPQMAVTISTLESTAERYREWLTSVTTYSAVAGALALLLALTGVYAVVSFSVSQRVAEIAIRMALGARRSDIISMVLGSAAASVGGGLLVGMGLALAASAGIEATVFGLDPRDPLMFAVIPAFLLITALGAMWIPARRAASLDPTSSLRSL